VTRPEVVLMDIHLPGLNGVECVRQLKELLPETQAVMLTVYENTNIIFSALAAGASGYLLKKSSPEQLIESHPRSCINGGSPMTSHIARKVVASFQQVTNPVHDYEKLSLREQEVLDYLGQRIPLPGNRRAAEDQLSHGALRTSGTIYEKNCTFAPAHRL